MRMSPRTSANLNLQGDPRQTGVTSLIESGLSGQRGGPRLIHLSENLDHAARRLSSLAILADSLFTRHPVLRIDGR